MVVTPRIREFGLMTPVMEEPLVKVRPRPKPFFLRPRFLLIFTPFGAFAVAGLVTLLLCGNLLLPFQRLVTLEGKAGSKAVFFNDEQVRKILLRHHLQVHISQMGSQAAVDTDHTSDDFVFTSGQPSAELLLDRLRTGNRYNIVYRPFVSPIVLATYREYAETLQRNSAATPQRNQIIGQPLYYNLNLTAFLNLIRQHRTWDQLGIRAFGISSGNQVLAKTTDVCRTNGGPTYLGMVSYLIHGRVPTSDREAEDFATDIKPLLGDGLPEDEPVQYFVQEGKATPIIVMYEHQYLSYQLQAIKRMGKPDYDRVLLYPYPGFQTLPEFIALTKDGDQLGQLLNTDPQLRRRELELGLRVLDPTGANSSEQMARFLIKQRVQAPSIPVDYTRAELPEVNLLDKMDSVIYGCH
jgi:hypothetical protein